MSIDTTNTDLPEPFLHEDSGAVRLWVRTATGLAVGGIARPEVLGARFRTSASGVDLLALYRRHRTEIDAAVLRRFAAGSLEPILLREADFNAR